MRDFSIGLLKLEFPFSFFLEYKTKLINELKLKLNDEKFINKSGLLLNRFSRSRLLPFSALVLFIIQKSNGMPVGFL